MAHELLAITDRDRATLTKLTASRRTPPGPVHPGAHRPGVRRGHRGKGRPSLRGEFPHRSEMEATLRTVRHRGTGRRTANWPPRCNRRGGPPGFDVRAAGTSGTRLDDTLDRRCHRPEPIDGCRIRRDHFPKSAIETGPKLAEQSAILSLRVCRSRPAGAGISTAHPRRPIVTAAASPRPGRSPMPSKRCSARLSYRSPPHRRRNPRRPSNCSAARRGHPVQPVSDRCPGLRAGQRDEALARRNPRIGCRRCSARALAGATSCARGGRRRSPAARTGRPTAAYPRLVRWARARVRMVSVSTKF